MAHPHPLHGVRVAILVDNGFERGEVLEPREALHSAGAKTTIVSPQSGSVRGWDRGEKTDPLKVDLTIADAKPLNFDALLLPGGVQNADSLRANNKAVLFVHAMQIAKKPIASVSHGAWMLVETDYVRGRKLTSSPSLRTDVVNAGGDWIDRAVVSDDLLVTSREGEALSQFNDAMIVLFTPPEQTEVP